MKNELPNYERPKIIEIEEEYAPDYSLFNSESDVYDRVKKIIWTKLTLGERRIILIYAETKNIRKTAEIFRISTSTMWAQIQRIKSKIISNYKKIKTV